MVVDGEVIGKVGDTVTVNEEGYLCVNGTATAIKAGKYAILENDANGVYTITLPDANGELKTIELAKASTNLQVSRILENHFESINHTTSGSFTSKVEGTGASAKYSVSSTDFKHSIAWGSASNDVKWGGLKGNITKDQLLVGATPTAIISILPASLDLSAEELTLVNTMGNTAAVKITASAVENAPLTSTSRAIKNAGAWELSMEMTSDVTTQNVGTKFTSEEKNVAYALAVNGTVVTDYVFYIDTYTNTQSTNNAAIDLSSNTDGKQLTIKNSSYAIAYFENNKTCDATIVDSKKIKLGGETLEFVGTEAHKIYDAYIELTDKDMANRYGITANGMTITASDKAANVTDFPFTVHIVDVKGNTFKENFKVKFGSTTAEAETLEAQSFKVTPSTEYFIVDLGTTFTSLTDEQADKVGREGGSITWAIDDKTCETLNSGNLKDITYYTSKEDAENNKDAVVMNTAATIKTAKFARIAFDSNLKSDPKAGANQATITLKDINANEIKKVETELSLHCLHLMNCLQKLPAKMFGPMVNVLYVCKRI